jgi:hypothetical protein
MEHPMKSMSFLCSLAAAAAAAALTAFVLRSEVHAAEDDGWKEKLAVVAAYMKAATSNEKHDELCERAGEWTFEATTYLGPAPETTSGTATFEPILDGRYVVQRTAGKMLGGDFDGFGINGYDNVAEEFFTVWVDSWSTGIYEMRGQAPAEGQPLVLEGQARDAMSPEGRLWRMVETKISDDEFRTEVFDTIPGGEGPGKTLVAVLHYRRADRK